MLLPLHLAQSVQEWNKRKKDFVIEMKKLCGEEVASEMVWAGGGPTLSPTASELLCCLEWVRGEEEMRE